MSIAVAGFVFGMMAPDIESAVFISRSPLTDEHSNNVQQTFVGMAVALVFEHDSYSSIDWL